MSINITKEMQLRSEVNLGNPYRLLKMFEKARRGEKISFVAIGGSVTMGCHSSTDETCYAALIAKWLRETFPQCEVKFENAGIGATDSTIALHRLKQDVFKYEPDFVVVEFSVNENNDDKNKIAYDNLVYNLLNYEKNPAVLLLSLMTNSGGNAQYVHSQVGRHYNLPIISYRDGLWPEVESGNIAWSDLAKDMVHPNDNGHYAAAKFVTNYLEELLDLSFDEYAESEKIQHLTNPKYLNARIYYPYDIEPASYGCFNIEDVHLRRMGKGWTARTNGEPLEFYFENCTRVFVLFERTNRGDGGKVLVSANDKEFMLDADFKDGWGLYANNVIVFDSDTPDNVSIKITPQLEENKQFSVIGMMVS